MLRRLQIKDFAIVDRLEMEFSGGFGALTGETGAGKSILVDALALALGDRGDASAVRVGRERADISAEFDLTCDSAAAIWLASNDFLDEPGVALLRRVVDAGGRSRAYINGATATAAQLRELGGLLADIHGQHAHHALLKSESQRDLLDSHAGLEALAGEVSESFRQWQRLKAAREGAEADVEATAREREMLDWQIAEFSRLGFDADTWQNLNDEHRRLGHAATLLAGVAEVLQLLDEGDLAVLGSVERLGTRLEGLAEYDARLGDPGALIGSAASDLSEAVRALRHYRDSLDIDPQRLADIDARIAAVTDIARKHRVTADELPKVAARLVARRAQLEQLGDAQLLAGREEAARVAYLEKAQRLSEGRQRAAVLLSTEVSASMQALAMPGGRLEVALDPLQEGSANGLEGVELRVAANAGQPLRPLARVASGGELSRIGLAIQVITSARGSTPTLVFDEVDVGIGGAVAEIVGRLLHRLGSERQVLCVTHLPQVAAQADWQWSVAKDQDGEAASSRVRELAGTERVEEIARMLGGVEITETTRRHAREMLDARSRQLGRRGV